MRNTSRFVACALALLGCSAALSAEPSSATALSAQEQATLKKYLAALLSARSQVLDLKYIEPDANGDNAGWGVNYKWNASKDDADLAEDERSHHSS